jgi:hypothetical protein
MKYIDDVVDNVTFDKEHDDVVFQTKELKLTKEDKTTGLIEWRRVDCVAKAGFGVWGLLLTG